MCATGGRLAQAQVAEADLGRSAGMDLQCDAAVACTIWVADVHAGLAVDEGLDALARGDDLVAIPVTGIQEGGLWRRGE